METTHQNHRPSIGDIYLMRFSGVNNEQSGWRPGVILQNNTGNQHSPNIIALPITGFVKKSAMPTHVVLHANNTGLLKDSTVLCENPEKMSKSKLGKYLCTLSPRYMRKIAIAYLLATSVISFLSEDDILKARMDSIRLNDAAS